MKCPNQRINRNKLNVQDSYYDFERFYYILPIVFGRGVPFIKRAFAEIRIPVEEATPLYLERL